MKLKPNFELRDVCGEQVVIPCGIENVNFDSIIHLNETGAFLFKLLQQGAEREDLVSALLEEYDVAPDRAAKDVDVFIQKVRDADVLE